MYFFHTLLMWFIMLIELHIMSHFLLTFVDNILCQFQFMLFVYLKNRRSYDKDQMVCKSLMYFVCLFFFLMMRSQDLSYWIIYSILLNCTFSCLFILENTSQAPPLEWSVTHRYLVYFRYAVLQMCWSAFLNYFSFHVILYDLFPCHRNK